MLFGGFIHGWFPQVMRFTTLMVTVQWRTWRWLDLKADIAGWWHIDIVHAKDVKWDFLFTYWLTRISLFRGHFMGCKQSPNHAADLMIPWVGRCIPEFSHHVKVSSLMLHDTPVPKWGKTLGHLIISKGQIVGPLGHGFRNLEMSQN